MEFEFSLWSPVAMESSQLMSTLKHTHIDTYLDFNSYHDSQHKVITASTLLHKALYLPNCSEAKTKKKKRRKRELNYVHAAVEFNGYRSKFIQNMGYKKLDP